MKKNFIFAILIGITLNFVFMFPAHANNIGDVVGNIYSTDIVAFIDGMAIPSYNIGGVTVVIAEDLREYGFEVDWNEDYRQLNITIAEMPKSVPVKDIKTDSPGRIVGNLLFTDITTRVNSVLIESYNIGGRTVIPLEALAKEYGDFYRDRNYNNGIGFSNAGFRAVWDETNRTISLFCLRPQMRLSTNFGNAQIITFYSIYHSGLAYDPETGAEVPIIIADGNTYFGIEKLFELKQILLSNQEGVLHIRKNNDDEIVLKKSTSLLSYTNTYVPLLSFNITVNDKEINEVSRGVLILDGHLFINEELLEKEFNVHYSNDY